MELGINKGSSVSFKGYEAAKLRGLFVTDKNCAETLKHISKETGLDIFQPNIASKSIRKELLQLEQANKLLWAQDYITFLNHTVKAVLFDNSRDFLKRVLRSCSDGLQKELKYTPVKSEPHLRGGNFFLCTNNGQKELLISENRKLYPDEILKTVFDVKKIITIPKMDYHLDLFIRPLDNGNILVSDINLTKKGLQNGIEKINKYIEKNNPAPQEKEKLENIIDELDAAIEKLNITLKFDKYKPQETVNQVTDTLKNAGYNPIRVPGSYHYLGGLKTKEREQELLNNFKNNSEALIEWSQNQSEKTQQKVNQFIFLESLKSKYDKYFGTELESFYENNFINAIVNKKPNGEYVYITNAPLLDTKLGITPEIEAKTGFSTKQMFIENVEPYIPKENIYFINEKLTNKLFKYMGGIHCTAAEIPV